MDAMLATENLWRAWSFEPLVLAGAIAATGFFAQGWRRLRRRRADLAPWSRVALFVSGVFLVTLAIVSPIDAIGERYLQSVHMLQHLLIADAGVVLILLAVRGPLAFFFLPPGLLAPLARAQPLRWALSFLLRPAVSFVAWLTVLVVWHLPPAYEAGLHHSLVHDAEHLSFIAAGTLVWTQLIDPARHRRLTSSQRLGYTALVYWAGQALAYTIAFSFTPLFPTYVDQPSRLLDLSALTDQKIAALAMVIEQTITVGGCFFLLLRASQRRQRRRALASSARQPA